jgi:hypothetical protein
MYPAVGNFKETVKFYYGYGNREVSPYPNRLLKVTAVVERSSTREAREFYFNSLGVLVCVLVNDGSFEQGQYFFVRGRLVSLQKGEITGRPGRAESVSATRALKAESDRVMRIFRASVE